MYRRTYLLEIAVNAVNILLFSVVVLQFSTTVRITLPQYNISLMKFTPVNITL